MQLNNQNLILFFLLFSRFLPAGGTETIKDHCNKTVDIFEDVTSPELTNL